MGFDSYNIFKLIFDGYTLSGVESALKCRWIIKVSQFSGMFGNKLLYILFLLDNFRNALTLT